MDPFLKKIFTDGKNRIKSIFNNDQKKAGLNWFRVRQLKYKTDNKIASYSLNGQIIYFTNGNELLHSLREIFVDEIYKMKLKSPTPTLLDCGANIGLSVVYLKKLFPEASIIAFEPDESNCRLLEKNTAGLSKVKIIQEAIWRENTTISFDQSGTLSSKIVSGIAENVSKVKATRLKDYLQHQQVDFLKLDIEGAEYEVIKDCAEVLGKVENIFIEYHGYFNNQNELNEILAIVCRSGFSYYIKEAAPVYATPFSRSGTNHAYNIQLNIFCFKVQ